MRYCNRSIKDYRGIHDGPKKVRNTADIEWTGSKVTLDSKHPKRIFACFCGHLSIEQVHI